MSSRTTIRKVQVRTKGEKSATLHVQGHALTFPPFSVFGARLQLAREGDRPDPFLKPYVITFLKTYGASLLLKAESAGAKGRGKVLRAGFHELYGCPSTFNITDTQRRLQLARERSSASVNSMRMEWCCPLVSPSLWWWQ